MSGPEEMNIAVYSRTFDSYRKKQINGTQNKNMRQKEIFDTYAMLKLFDT